eukprot:GHVN01034865.1.p1 GENE.GHVN01034865.1~~GHVN01034865.1.p1  ORF type:complete len:107 (+),score=15.75 GHVN01034865.1:109-429(+)
MMDRPGEADDAKRAEKPEFLSHLPSFSERQAFVAGDSALQIHPDVIRLGHLMATGVVKGGNNRTEKLLRALGKLVAVSDSANANHPSQDLDRIFILNPFSYLATTV